MGTKTNFGTVAPLQWPDKWRFTIRSTQVISLTRPTGDATLFPLADLDPRPLRNSNRMAGRALLFQAAPLFPARAISTIS